jgi:uridine phosphorylase
MSHGFESAERVRDEQGRQYHIGLVPRRGRPLHHAGRRPRPRHPRRRPVRLVEHERRNREFVTYTGVHSGLRVTVMGTGMGGGPTEIAVVELCQLVERPS